MGVIASRFVSLIKGPAAGDQAEAQTQTQPMVEPQGNRRRRVFFYFWTKSVSPSVSSSSTATDANEASTSSSTFSLPSLPSISPGIIGTYSLRPRQSHVADGSFRDNAEGGADAPFDEAVEFMAEIVAPVDPIAESPNEEIDAIEVAAPEFARTELCLRNRVVPPPGCRRYPLRKRNPTIRESSLSSVDSDYVETDSSSSTADDGHQGRGRRRRFNR